MAIEVTQINESAYNEILQQAVAVIDKARSSAAKSVCTVANFAHWSIGKMLHEQKVDGHYGDGIVKRLSVDLKQRYPQMGLSPRQLWNMKRFYLRYSDSDEKLLRSVAVLPWSHILLLMSKELNDEAVLYYANEIVAKGWNRDLLLNAIKMEMHVTQKPVVVDNNFAQVLPATQAMYANEVFRSGYNLGFLGVTKPIGVADYQLILPKKELVKVVQDEIDMYIKDTQNKDEEKLS